MTLVQIAPIKIFQLTPSRRATITGRRPYLILKFQLTPSRRATEIDKVYQKCMEISTHALTEGDPPLFVEVSGYENFNSRPHGGRRHENINSRHHIHFNSRPHGGRPTGAMSRRRWFRYFNSRPHGGRQVCDVINLEFDHFNSRPHGGRQGYTGSSSRRKEFQLTPSRRATEAAGYMVVTEGFQLTPSRRATPSRLQTRTVRKFQLTPSRRATRDSEGIRKRLRISTHALTEGDETGTRSWEASTDFNSRPHGGRQRW